MARQRSSPGAPIRWQHILVGEKGGEDRVSTGASIHPSRPFYTHNMEWLPTGGLARIKGYERYDGQAANMAAVPGSGPVRGVAIFADSVWAWRDNAGATALVMHKATAGGWVAQSLGVTLTAGGRVRTEVANFSGSSTGSKIYGCDGKNKAFEWDGTTYTGITSGGSPDTPTHIEFHVYRLWLGLPGGLVRFSPVGNPVGTWGDSSTSGVIGLGDEITGLLSLPGGTLGIFCRNSISILSGSISGAEGDFQVKPNALDVGAREDSVARFANDGFFLDRMGVQSLTTTQNFGDFASSVISNDIRPFIDSNRDNFIDHLVVHDKSQYRLFFDGGGAGSLFCIGTIIDNKVWWSTGRYGFEVACTARGEIEGNECLFAGGSDGMVYRLDTSNAFDGDEYISSVIMAYANQNAIGILKDYRGIRLECESTELINLKFKPIFDYSEGPKGIIQEISMKNRGDRWGIDDWNSMIWGGVDVSASYGDLQGFGESVSIAMSHTSNTTEPYTIRAISYKYSYRRAAN